MHVENLMWKRDVQPTIENRLEIGHEIAYKNRVLTLNILPLAVYLELHSLLLYCIIVDGEYNININQFILSTTQIKEQDTADMKAMKIFGTAIWYNIFCRLTDLRSKSKRKERITNITHFLRTNSHKQFMENDPCTWRVCCLCTNCNIHTKLIWLTKKGVDHPWMNSRSILYYYY